MRTRSNGCSPKPPRKSSARRLAAMAGLWLAVSGCQQVKPWQRETLADPVMRADRDPLGLALNEHVWFSREAVTGGRGVGGGGCGCN